MLAEARVPTTTPAATLSEVLQFFRDAQVAHGPLDALGIGSFGPLDLQARLPDLRLDHLHPEARLGRIPTSPARCAAASACRWRSTPT